MNINMWELLITALTSIIGTGVVGWLVFFKWKRKALISALMRQSKEDEIRYLELIENKAEELGKKLVAKIELSDQLRDRVRQLEQSDKEKDRHIGVLFNSCKCSNTEEVIRIRKLYDARKGRKDFKED